MRQTARYDVVICARNNVQIIAATLQQVARQTVPAARCIVVDGRSTDGMPEMIRAEFPSVEVLVKDKDDGPASSRNIGAGVGSSEYVLFLDSDVTLATDWAEEQLAFLAEYPHCAAVCGLLHFRSEPDRVYATFGAMNRYAVAWEIGRGQTRSSQNEVRRCLWCATASMLVRRAVFLEMGGFDAVMFAFQEDTDFGWRMNLFGYDVFYNPRAHAGHEVHGTMTPKSMGSRIAALAYRNRFRSALMNYEWPNVLRYVLAHLVLFLGQTLYREPRVVRLQAVIWNIRNLRSTLLRRKAVQQGRRRSDRELWPLFEAGLSGPGYRYD